MNCETYTAKLSGQINWTTFHPLSLLEGEDIKTKTVLENLVSRHENARFESRSDLHYHTFIRRNDVFSCTAADGYRDADGDASCVDEKKPSSLADNAKNKILVSMVLNFFLLF